MTRYRDLCTGLSSPSSEPRTWLVTGAAGFIGSALVEQLLALGQTVVGLDNFITGHRRNIDDAIAGHPAARGQSFRFIEGDIRDLDVCRRACEGVDHVLHQAALGSVPRSIDRPLETHSCNVDGFLHIALAARDAGVERVVYASSSSVYGDDPRLPKVEDHIGQPLSPYAVTKLINEQYASIMETSYGLECVGLRYFNVFGRRQDPRGAYAAVIPRWIGSLLAGEPCQIFGDGEQSRDFCYIDNVIQANLLGACVSGAGISNQIYNVGCNGRTTLNELFYLIRDALAEFHPGVTDARPVHTDPRPGDIQHSQADISKITERLGYRYSHELVDGLRDTVAWFAARGNTQGV